ncbi:ABC transporter ATP-binding protein [Ruminococcus sp.]|uniref:ABC transporter ATP-binding protein n=1 Tax=Ruminococcus sp. TaxID=41978 RepID=UPI00388D47AB
MAFLTIENLSFTYPESRQKALDSVSLQAERGEFITLMGATGSGKSTLMRLLKPQLDRNGIIEGSILFDGKAADSLDARAAAGQIGYVAQSPEEQLVTDKVWHELAFTLESLGRERGLIARRIAEIASYFGIDRWLDRDTATLSGGEKQLLNLAAVMTADPQLLLLDEPTSQLDPIAAARFIETVYRLNRETGVTVLICEHRAEELFPICDRVMMLDGGRLTFDDTPQKVASLMSDSPFLPTAARLFHALGGAGEAPLSVRDGKRMVEGFHHAIRALPEEPAARSGEEALQLKQVYFRYERKGADILRDMELTVYRGEVFALLGANGAGKSTAAAVIAGLRKPYCGTVRLFGKRLRDYRDGSLYRGAVSLLPQDVESVFIAETVREELKGCETAMEKLPYDFTPLLDRHPYDISGGERQLVALCRALASSPRLLILDEPSKGLDNAAKELLCEVIRRLKGEGMTILLITHDVELAALCADRCALFAQGRIAAADTTGRFMSDNRFYTTAASRITRRRYDGAYTVARAAALMKRNGGAL